MFSFVVISVVEDSSLFDDVSNDGFMKWTFVPLMLVEMGMN